MVLPNAQTTSSVQSLARNSLVEGGILPLESFLAGNKSLRSLNLSGNSLTDADADVIAEVVSQNTHLHELDLSCNKFGELAGVRRSPAAAGAHPPLL